MIPSYRKEEREAIPLEKKTMILVDHVVCLSMF